MEASHLLHILEHLITSPLVQIPVVVILFRPADTQSTINAARTAKKTASANFNLTIVNLFHGFRNDVPIRLSVEVIAPSACQLSKFTRKEELNLPSCHMNIL